MQKLQGIVRDLQEIDNIRHKVSDIQVPLEVFDYIDTGRNPQLYTKDCMEKAVSKNEEVLCFNIQSRYKYWISFFCIRPPPELLPVLGPRMVRRRANNQSMKSTSGIQIPSELI